MVFWRKKKSEQNGPLVNGKGPTSSDRTVLGLGWRLKGRVYGKGQLILQGGFEGELDIQGHLTVDPSANVIGTFRAEEIRIGDRLEGTLESSRILALEKTARVDGQIQTPRLQMADGAQLNAQIEMKTKAATFQEIGG